MCWSCSGRGPEEPSPTRGARLCTCGRRRMRACEAGPREKARPARPSGGPGHLVLGLLLSFAGHPLPARGLSARQYEILPGAADRSTVGGESSLEIGGPSELRIDPVKEHLAVYEGSLQAPLPAPLKGVLSDQEGARLSQREDPLVAARKVADVPVAAERLRVRRQRLPEPADALAQEVDPPVRVLDIGADPARLLGESLDRLLDSHDLLFARLHQD